MKTNIQQSADQCVMEGYFKKYLSQFFPDAQTLNKLKIKVERNFLNKWDNIALRYILSVETKKGIKKIVVRGRATANAEAFCHYKILKYIYKIDLSFAARPLSYIPSFHALLYEEVAGTPISILLKKRDTKAFPKIMKECGTALSALHEFRVPMRLGLLRRSFHYEYKDINKDLHLLLRFAPHEKKSALIIANVLRKNLESIYSSGQTCIIHGDFQLGNIIKTKKGVRVIDFGSAQIGNPLFDVGRFIFQCKTMFNFYGIGNNQEKKDQLIKLFCENYSNEHLFSRESQRSIAFYQLRAALQIMSVFALIISNPTERAKSIRQIYKTARDLFNWFK